MRWKFDPSATDPFVEPRELIPIQGEMPRVDDRFCTKPYNTLFLAMTNTTLGREKAVTGGSYNSVAACDVGKGTYKYWSAGPEVTIHEVAFVPRTPDGTELFPFYSVFASLNIAVCSLIYTANIVHFKIMFAFPLRFKNQS